MYLFIEESGEMGTVGGLEELNRLGHAPVERVRLEMHRVLQLWSKTRNNDPPILTFRGITQTTKSSLCRVSCRHPEQRHST